MDPNDHLDRYLREDIGAGDATTIALGIGEKVARGQIVCLEDCILAGVQEAMEIFYMLGAEAISSRADGERVEAGTMVLDVKGTCGPLLSGERLALNVLGRMSGIATVAHNISEALREKNPDVRVAATRKTTPGFRYYEKKAVEIGGGEPHRQGLYDMILIKDNHISVLGSITEAVKLARENSKLVVEVEADTLEQAREAAAAGADIVMLDNMTPEMVSEGYSAVKAIDPNIMVEVSGGITPENIILYARCADRISMSRITSYSKPVDFTFHMV